MMVLMGRLVVNNSMSVNGAFEAPQPEPDGWLLMDPDTNQVSLEQFYAADAMVLGRKTYEGLAAVWPTLVDVPGFGVFAQQMNSMPKYVASTTLRAPLEWNATLLEGDLAESITRLKVEHDRTLVAVGAGELTKSLDRRRPRGRVLVLGEPGCVARGPAGSWTASVRSAGADGRHHVQLRRGAPGVPPGSRLGRERLEDLVDHPRRPEDPWKNARMNSQNVSAWEKNHTHAPKIPSP